MQIFEELTRRNLIAQVTDEEEIKELINAGKAVFYIGFDPTADSLHIGHFMALCLMKRLQLAGNKPIILVGGATGSIGDPSGKTDMRKMMTPETIDHNCECFVKQIGKYIDLSKAEVVNNKDWIMNLGYIEMLKEVGPYFSVNRMLSAECYKQRMERGLTFFEFNYMIMQSYDFLKLYEKFGCNMQFGGDDQWSNMLAGTELIRKKLGKNAYALTQRLLLNSENKKMGKTEKGTVWLDETKTSPYDFFQYWRNVGDADVIPFMKMLTFIPVEEIEALEADIQNQDINALKSRLAFEITKMIHGESAAEKARESAIALFSGGSSSDTENMPTTTLTADDLKDGSIGILDLLAKTGLAPSKSEAKRLVLGNGIAVDNEKIASPDTLITVDKPLIIKKGKKIYHKVTV